MILKKEEKCSHKKSYIIFRSSIVIIEIILIAFTIIYQNDTFIEDNLVTTILPFAFQALLIFTFTILLFIFFPRIYTFFLLMDPIVLIFSNISDRNSHPEVGFLFNDILFFVVLFFVFLNLYYYKGFFFSTVRASAKAISSNKKRIFSKFFLSSFILYVEFISTTCCFFLLLQKKSFSTSNIGVKLGVVGLGFLWTFLVYIFFVYLKNYYFFVGASFLANKHRIYSLQSNSKKNKKLALTIATKDADKHAETIFKATRNNLWQIVVPKRMLTFPNSQTLVRAAIYKKNYEESLDMTKEVFSGENLKPFCTWNLVTTVFLLMHFLTYCSWSCSLLLNLDNSSPSVFGLFTLANLSLAFAFFTLILPFFSFVGGIAGCQLALVVEAPEKLKKVNKKLFEFFKNKDDET